MLDDRKQLRLSVLFVICAVLFISPHRMVDSDSISHLSVGRWIVQNAEVPEQDPFTFVHPSRKWSNPEWLGDVIWYGLYSLGGEAGTQVLKFLAILAGLVLAFRRSSSRGAPPVLTAALMLILLPACAGRFTMRNHIHALWLIPLFQIIADRAHERRVLWLTLLPLGWVWGNIHSSFVIGCGVVAASALDRRSNDQEVDWKMLGAILLLLAILPVAGPQGLSAYTQLWDHLVGAGVYRRFLAEWQSPLTSPALLAIAPLHLVAATGLLALAWERNRRPAGAVVLLVLGLAAAYMSRRFIPFVLVLAVPHIAVCISSVATHANRKVMIATALVVVGYAGVATWVLMRAERPLLQRPATARKAAEFLAQHAPPGSRVFNSFNAGPWLLWYAPGIQHYIDPRNNHAPAFLDEYVQLLEHPRALTGMMDRLDVDLALLALADRRANGIVGILDASPGRWRLVFLDGYHALYARTEARTANLSRRFGYRVVRARGAVDFKTLDHRATTSLTRDLAQLRNQGPVLAVGHEACLRALHSGLTSPDQVLATVKLVQSVAAQMPPSGTLMACLVSGLERANLHAAASEARRQARLVFPQDPVFSGRVSGGAM
jgi:hypothetical protein